MLCDIYEPRWIIFEFISTHIQTYGIFRLPTSLTSIGMGGFREHRGESARGSDLKRMCGRIKGAR